MGTGQPGGQPERSKITRIDMRVNEYGEMTTSIVITVLYRIFLPGPNDIRLASKSGALRMLY